MQHKKGGKSNLPSSNNFVLVARLFTFFFRCSRSAPADIYLRLEINFRNIVRPVLKYSFHLVAAQLKSTVFFIAERDLLG